MTWCPFRGSLRFYFAVAAVAAAASAVGVPFGRCSWAWALPDFFLSSKNNAKSQEKIRGLRICGVLLPCECMSVVVCLCVFVCGELLKGSLHSESVTFNGQKATHWSTKTKKKLQDGKNAIRTKPVFALNCLLLLFFFFFVNYIFFLFRRLHFIFAHFLCRTLWPFFYRACLNFSAAH